jgi:signal transduction histidine kinase
MDAIVATAALVVATLVAVAYGFPGRLAMLAGGAPAIAAGAVAAVWTLLPIAVVWFARRRVLDARRSVAQRDEFLESIAHHLRTPLSSVVGYSLLMRDEPQQARVEDLKWMLDEVATRSVEAADLLDDMLVAAHLEHGGLQLLPAPIDLSDETEWVLRNYLGDTSVDVEYRGVRRWALGDPVRVRQILRILLANAQGRGGSELRMEVDTSGDDVRVAVAHNGRDVPSNGDKAFDRFLTDTSSDEGRSPFGASLAVASQLAERMGGTIRHRAEDGWTWDELLVPSANRGAITFDPPVYLGHVDLEAAVASM